MPLRLTRKSIGTSGRQGYRVYKNHTEFVEIEALLASEAVEKSGITAPYKVERIGMVSASILDGTMLTDRVDSAPSGNTEAAAATSTPPTQAGEDAVEPQSAGQSG